MNSQIQVRFSVRSRTEPPEITGEIIHDPVGRGKIVFLNGFRNNWQTWKGQLPKDEEEWCCEVVRDTMPDRPHKGALLVRLVRKAEQKKYWDCSLNSGCPELFGTRPPIVSCVERIGVREENAEKFRVGKNEDIEADWPEEIRIKAAKMLAEYLGSKERFTGLVQWPILPPNDPSPRDFDVEVGGYECRIHTCIMITVNGVERDWRLYGPVNIGGRQVINTEIKAESGKSFVITQYAELEALVFLFGKPDSVSACFGNWPNDTDNRGKVIWGQLQIALNPEVLFGGPNSVEVGTADKYGNVSAVVILTNLGFAAEIRGFKVEPEQQKAVYLRKVSGEADCWRPYSGIGFGQYQHKAKPVVVPAKVNWAAEKFLSEEQQSKLIAVMPKWSLADHTCFFRSALLNEEAGVIKEIHKDSEFLARLVAEKNFAIELVQYSWYEGEYESPDGMRMCGGVTHYEHHSSLVSRCRYSTTVYVRLDNIKDYPGLVGNLDAAIRWFITERTNKFRADLQNLRVAFAAMAQYEKSPEYAEPSDTVSSEKREEIDRKIKEFFTPLQKVLDSADALLAREDYSVRQENERMAEQKKCEKIRGRALAVCDLPHFAHLDHKLQCKLQYIGGIPNKNPLFGYEFEDFSTMTAERLRHWQTQANQVLEDLVVAEPSAKELKAKIEQGEILTDFGGHFRVMGATGNAQYWVIRPDGSQREPDEVSYRKRYTSEGEKNWCLVGLEELAISWFKANTAADHEFVVNKLPVGECTPEQLETVVRLEQELEERFYGRTGLTSGELSPEIGLGWNLKPKIELESAIGSSEKSEIVDLSTLTTLFGTKIQRRK